MHAPNKNAWLASGIYAYRKLRHWHCPLPAALIRACIFALTGDTGYVKVSRWSKRRLSRE